MTSSILKFFLLKKKNKTLHIQHSLPLLHPAPQNEFIISSQAVLSDLSGHINLVTGGTKMPLAEGYLSLSGTQEHREHLPRRALSTNYNGETGASSMPPQHSQAGFSRALCLARLLVFVSKDASEIGRDAAGDGVTGKSACCHKHEDLSGDP